MLFEQLKMKDLEAFAMVVECGSITTAAQKLYTTQPALSRRMHEIEEMAGQKLLNRGKNGVELTNEGKAFYSFAEQTLSQCNALEKNYNEHLSDMVIHLRVGYTSSFHFNLYAEAIEKLRKRFPKSKIELIEYAGGHDIINGLQSKEIDIGYCSSLYIDGKRNLASKKIDLLRCNVILKSDTALSKEKEVSLSQLTNQTLLLPNPEVYPANVAFIQDLLKKEEFDYKIEYVDSIEKMLFMIRCGLGVGFLVNIVKMLEDDLLTSIPLLEDTQPRYRVVVWNTNNNNPGIQQFLQAID